MSVVNIKIKSEEEKKPVFTPEDNLVTRLQAAIQEAKAQGKVIICGTDLFRRIVDNYVGRSIMEYCHSTGITVEQLRKYLEDNPPQLHKQYNTLDKTHLAPSREVSINMESSTLKTYKGRIYPVCSSCKEIASVHLPICPVCGTKMEIPDKAKSIMEASSREKNAVIVSNDEVHVTQADVDQAAQDLIQFKKQSQ